MIRYALICDLGHDFEGWFGASADFDDQAARGLMACPVCASLAVRKQIMAPAVAGTKARGSAERLRRDARHDDGRHEVRRHVEDNPTMSRTASPTKRDPFTKARRRSAYYIYGEASQAEVKALVTDGFRCRRSRRRRRRSRR